MPINSLVPIAAVEAVAAVAAAEVAAVAPILTNLGPHLAPKVRETNAPGGMRGAPGDSRFKLKLSFHSSYTVAPEGVAGFNRFAHSAVPGYMSNRKYVGILSPHTYIEVVGALGGLLGRVRGLWGASRGPGRL